MRLDRRTHPNQAIAVADWRRHVRDLVTSRLSLPSLAAQPLKEAEQWLSQYRAFWEGTFDSLERYLSQEENKEDN